VELAVGGERSGIVACRLEGIGEDGQGARHVARVARRSASPGGPGAELDRSGRSRRSDEPPRAIERDLCRKVCRVRQCAATSWARAASIRAVSISPSMAWSCAISDQPWATVFLPASPSAAPHSITLFASSRDSASSASRSTGSSACDDEQLEPSIDHRYRDAQRVVERREDGSSVAEDLGCLLVPSGMAQCQRAEVAEHAAAERVAGAPHRLSGPLQVVEGGDGVSCIGVDIPDRHQRVRDAQHVPRRVESLQHGELLEERLRLPAERAERPRPVVAGPGHGVGIAEPRRQVHRLLGDGDRLERVVLVEAGRESHECALTLAICRGGANRLANRPERVHWR
jgi:hypothetical protein